MTAGDACPGILDLHEARDGLVARIRLPGGYATGRRLRDLAALASRFGNGCVDLTARGNVQLRGIRADEADDLAGRAASVGLLPAPDHDRARNITASPLAGLAGHPDLRRLVRALDYTVRADPALAALPGRFLFCLDDGTGRAGLSGCDVGLRLRPRVASPADNLGKAAGGTADLIVAGRETGLHGPVQQVVRQAIEMARAFLEQRPAVPSSASPGSTGPGSASPGGAGQGSTPPGSTAPGSMRVSGLPDGGAAITAALGGVLGEKVTDVMTRLPLGPVTGSAPLGADPLPLAVVAAPLGRLTAAQLRLIGSMVRPGEAARLTSAGRVVLPLAEPVDMTLTRLSGAGLLVSDEHVLSAVTACSGMSCSKSLADVRAQATRVPGLGAVHWAGCSRRCGRPADATAVVATGADEFIVTGGPAGRVQTHPDGPAEPALTHPDGPAGPALTHADDPAAPASAHAGARG